MKETTWTLTRDLDGHRVLVSQVTQVTILLEPNLDKPVSWLVEAMEDANG